MDFLSGCAAVIFIAGAVIIVIIFEPLIAIWCLNQLFNLGINNGLKEWASFLFLQGVFVGSIKLSTRD